MNPPAITSLSHGHLLGSITTGGLAIVLFAVLFWGVRGHGRHRFDHERAGGVGFIASTLALSSGFTAFQQITISLGSTIFGGAMGTFALFLVAWFWLGKPKPAKAAWLGIAAASICGLAGGIWAIPAKLIPMLFAHLGAQ